MRETAGAEGPLLRRNPLFRDEATRVQLVAQRYLTLPEC
jgi:hypothetical protein